MNKQIKHFTLRLPTGLSLTGAEDESKSLTRLRSMTELLSGERYTIHALLCNIIQQAKTNGHSLRYPKLFKLPAGTETERIDVRLNQGRIDILDQLREELEDQPEVIDFKEYYNRPECVRELLQLELLRVESVFGQVFFEKSSLPLL